MIPFLPTLANSDPWLTTNSFCSESSSTLTSMPWGEILCASSLAWGGDSWRSRLCQGGPWDGLTYIKVMAYLRVILCLHSDWMFVHIFRSSLIIQSEQNNCVSKLHQICRRPSLITSSLWPRWKMPQLPSCWKITLKYIFLTMMVPRRPRSWWQHSSQCHEDYSWDRRQ